MPTDTTDAGGKPKRKTHTSSTVKNRWRTKAYRLYQVNLRRDTEADLIAWIEDHRGEYSATDIFRAGLEVLMRAET